MPTIWKNLFRDVRWCESLESVSHLEAGQIFTMSNCPGSKQRQLSSTNQKKQKTINGYASASVCLPLEYMNVSRACCDNGSGWLSVGKKSWSTYERMIYRTYVLDMMSYVQHQSNLRPHKWHKYKSGGYPVKLCPVNLPCVDILPMHRIMYLIHFNVNVLMNANTCMCICKCPCTLHMFASVHATCVSARM